MFQSHAKLEQNIYSISPCSLRLRSAISISSCSISSCCRKFASSCALMSASRRLISSCLSCLSISWVFSIGVKGGTELFINIMRTYFKYIINISYLLEFRWESRRELPPRELPRPLEFPLDSGRDRGREPDDDAKERIPSSLLCTSLCLNDSPLRLRSKYVRKIFK